LRRYHGYLKLLRTLTVYQILVARGIFFDGKAGEAPVGKTFLSGALGGAFGV
jgi:hypothetical protein